MTNFNQNIPQKARIVSPTVWVTIVIAFFVGVISSAGAVELGYDKDALNPEQAALADEMLRFIEQMESKHYALVEKLNGDREVETKSFQDENSDYEIKVSRGDVIEKTGFTTSVTKLGVAPYTEDAIWSRVITINMHPKSPLVGYLHAFVSFQYNTNGKSSIGGWMDVIPAVRNEEDLDYIRKRVDSVFEKFGVDPSPYRKAICSGHRRDLLGPGCAAVSFYAPPFLSVTSENVALVNETFAALFDAYATVLEKRADQSYTESDLMAQDALRRRWLEDQMIHDPYAQHVIPHKVRSFANYPPTVKY